MKRKRETRRGGRSTSRFVLRNRTLILDVEGAIMKNLSKTFLKRDHDLLN